MRFIRPNKRKWEFVNELRLEYDLNEDSVVFDLGAYKGEFTQKISDKYRCRVCCYEPVTEFYNQLPILGKVSAWPFAVSNKHGDGMIFVNKDSSSAHKRSNRQQTIRYLTLSKAMRDNGVSHIDLIKINIEGDEYDLLDDMIEKCMLTKCTNIQVQFHRTVKNYLDRYSKIRKALEQSHQLTFRIPFLWENWQLLS